MSKDATNIYSTWRADEFNGYWDLILLLLLCAAVPVLGSYVPEGGRESFLGGPNGELGGREV